MRADPRSNHYRVHSKISALLRNLSKIFLPKILRIQKQSRPSQVIDFYSTQYRWFQSSFTHLSSNEFSFSCSKLQLNLVQVSIQFISVRVNVEKLINYERRSILPAKAALQKTKVSLLKSINLISVLIPFSSILVNVIVINYQTNSIRL